MPITTPSTSTWILRLKNNRTTVLLHVLPTSTWTAIKTELLHALRTTNTDGTLHGNAIPSSPDDVLLAKALDPNKLELGWVSLEPEDQDDADVEGLFGEEEEAATSSKAKGKAKAVPKSNSFKDSPQGAGLRDGAAVAFKFRGAEAAGPNAAAVPAPVGLGFDDEGFVDEESEEAAARARTDWDVVLPQYEDVYGIGELQPDDEMVTPRPNKFADFSGV